MTERTSASARAATRKLSGATCVALCAATVLTPAGVAAQTVPIAVDAQTEAGTSQAQVETQAVEDIVVTATKRTESVQTVPISVTALSSEQIKARGLESLQDISTAVPNFQWPKAFTPAQADISIRGIYSYISYGQIGIEPGFAVYLDGAYLGRPGSADLDLGDIERIEVLRGPQGTLFGKNAIAGVLNVVSAKPTNSFSGSGSAEYGSYNLVRTRGSLNLPLIDDRLAARVAIGLTRRDGYITNLYTGNSDLNNLDQVSGRVQLAFTPGSGTRFDLSIDMLRSKSDFTRGIVVPPASLATYPVDIINEDNEEFARKNNKGGSLTAVQALGGGYELTSITAYRDDRDYLRLDVDASTLSGNHPTQTTGQRQWSQELRIASPAARWGNVVAGLYFYDQRASLDRSTFSGIAAAAATRGIAFAHERVGTRSYAGFFNANVRLADRLELFGGARFTDERKTFSAQTDCDPVTVCPGGGQGVVSGVFYESPVALESDNISWTAGLRFKASGDLMTYASASRGFKSGAFNDVGNPFFSAAAGNLFAGPEHATSYEAGVKSRLFDRRLTANAAVFYVDYRDLQIRNFCPTCGVAGVNLFSNAASVTTKGFELELAAVPARGLTLSANVGYTDSRFDNYRGVSDPRPVALGGQGANVDVSGNSLPNAPKWTVNLGAQYEFDVSPSGSVVSRADYSFASPRFSAFGGALNNADTAIPARHIVNARLGYKQNSQNWSVFLYVKNLANQRKYDLKYYNSFISSGYFISWLEPRTVGAIAEVRF